MINLKLSAKKMIMMIINIHLKRSIKMSKNIENTDKIPIHSKNNDSPKDATTWYEKYPPPPPGTIYHTYKYPSRPQTIHDSPSSEIEFCENKKYK